MCAGQQASFHSIAPYPGIAYAFADQLISSHNGAKNAALSEGARLFVSSRQQRIFACNELCSVHRVQRSSAVSSTYPLDRDRRGKTHESDVDDVHFSASDQISKATPHAVPQQSHKKLQTSS